MSNEWQDLPNLAAVCAVQADRWYIEVKESDGTWIPWLGNVWSASWDYRGRPRPPKIKKVKLLGWITDFGCLALYREGPEMPNGWCRVPSEDKTVEVEV